MFKKKMRVLIPTFALFNALTIIVPFTTCCGGGSKIIYDASWDYAFGTKYQCETEKAPSDLPSDEETVTKTYFDYLAKDKMNFINEFLLAFNCLVEDEHELVESTKCLVSLKFINVDSVNQRVSFIWDWQLNSEYSAKTRVLKSTVKIQNFKFLVEYKNSLGWMVHTPYWQDKHLFLSDHDWTLDWDMNQELVYVPDPSLRMSTIWHVKDCNCQNFLEADESFQKEGINELFKYLEIKSQYLSEVSAPTQSR